MEEKPVETMPKKVLILLIANLVVTMLFVGGGFYSVSQKISSLEGGPNEDVEEVTEEDAESAIGPIYHLDTFVVNLADPEGERYLKTSIDLELNSAIEDEEDLEEQIKRRMPQIKDSILMILSTKRFTEVQSLQGKTSLKNEMIAQLNEILGEDTIKNVYFSEFVYQ